MILCHINHDVHIMCLINYVAWITLIDPRNLSEAEESLNRFIVTGSYI